MKKEDKYFDKLFRENLEHFEATPSDDVWKSIQQAIAKSKRRTNFMFWRVAAVLVIALAAGWPIWQYSQKHEEKFTATVITSSEQTISEIKKPEAKPELLSSSNEKNTSKKLFAANDPAYTKTNKKEKQITANEPVEKRLNEKIKPLQLLDGLLEVNMEAPNTIIHSLRKRFITEKNNELSVADQAVVRQNESMIKMSEKEINQRKWLVGAQVSPTLSLSESSHALLYASNMTNPGDNDQVRLAGGFSVEYKSGKRWSVQSGIYYSSMGESSYNTSSKLISPSTAFGIDGGSITDTPVKIQSNSLALNGIAGVIEFEKIPEGIQLSSDFENWSPSDNTLANEVEFIQNFEYIEIPLYLRYTLIDSRIGLQVLGGFSTNLLVGNDAYMQDETGRNRIGETEDMETLNYSGTIGFGLRYGLSKKVFVNVEPRLKYFLNSLNNNPEVDYKAYSVGFYTGLSYRF